MPKKMYNDRKFGWSNEHPVNKFHNVDYEVHI